MLAGRAADAISQSQLTAVVESLHALDAKLDRVEQLERHNSELAVLHAKQEQEAAHLADKMEDMHMMHSGRADEIVSLKRHVEKHWAELDTARQMVAKQVQSLGECSAELAALRKEKDQATSELARISAEFSTVTLERDRLQAQKDLRPVGR